MSETCRRVDQLRAETELLREGEHVRYTSASAAGTDLDVSEWNWTERFRKRLRASLALQLGASTARRRCDTFRHVGCIAGILKHFFLVSRQVLWV